MEINKKINSMLEWYDKKPLVKSLVQLIPYGGGIIDAHLESYVGDLKDKKLKTFFDELATKDLSEELIKDEDFVHAFIMTTNCAIRTKRKEKIRLFARLLAEGTKKKTIYSKTDKYDDYLKILDNITFTEIAVLHLIYDFFYVQKNQMYSPLGEPEFNSWKEVENKLLTWFDIKNANGFYHSLSKTGLCTLLTTTYPTGTIVGTGIDLTSDFTDLIDLLELKGEDFVLYSKINSFEKSL